jgi:hypothetical protein
MTQNETKKALRLRGGRYITIGIFLILIFGSTCIVVFTNASSPDLNANIPIVNSDFYNVWNGTNHVLWMSRVINATSDSSNTIWFWINATQFGDTRSVYFYYSNSTNGEYFNASQPYPQGSWNYLQWWTGFRSYMKDDFNTTSSDYPIPFTIPRQKGGTEITYQLTVTVWNGTGIEYNNCNGTYIVRYSKSEVLFEQKVHITTGLYWASLPILFGLLFVSWRVYKPEKEQEIQPVTRENEYHLTEQLLISRLDHLDTIISGLRTGAVVLFGVGTGGLLWLSSVLPPLQGYLNFGFLSFAFCSFTAIILTFSSAYIEKDGFRLSRGLIPSGQNVDEYRNHLESLVIKKESIIGNIVGIIGAGFVILATLAIMGFIMGFFPASDILGNRIWSMIPVWIALGLAYLDGLGWSVVIFGPKGLGIFED